MVLSCSESKDVGGVYDAVMASLHIRLHVGKQKPLLAFKGVNSKQRLVYPGHGRTQKAAVPTAESITDHCDLSERDKGQKGMGYSVFLWSL